jgi:prepilin-type N-terminal cleavage/methylation domain-containing protein
MKNKKRGFTLLELLVVVGLIAILSAVVIVSINNARSKGGDAGVKTNLHTVSNQAELFFLNNTNSYLPSGGSTFSIATCPTYSAVGTNMLSRDSIMAQAIDKAVNNGGNGSSCYNSSTAWAVAVGLKSSTTSSWCVDNTGSSRVVASAPASAINATTFSCN